MVAAEYPKDLLPEAADYYHWEPLTQSGWLAGGLVSRGGAGVGRVLLAGEYVMDECYDDTG